MTDHKYARLNAEGRVLEVFSPVDDSTGAEVLPAQVFPPALAEQFVQCPLEVQPDWIWTGKKWKQP